MPPIERHRGMSRQNRGHGPLLPESTCLEEYCALSRRSVVNNPSSSGPPPKQNGPRP